MDFLRFRINFVEFSETSDRNLRLPNLDFDSILLIDFIVVLGCEKGLL